MLSFFVRFLGFIILAAAFAALIVDGTRSVAGSEIIVTPFSVLVVGKMSAIEQFLTHGIHPILWDPIAKDVLRLPIWLVLAILGLMFLRLGQRQQRSVAPARRT